MPHSTEPSCCWDIGNPEERSTAPPRNQVDADRCQKDTEVEGNPSESELLLKAGPRGNTRYCLRVLRQLETLSVSGWPTQGPVDHRARPRPRLPGFSSLQKEGVERLRVAQGMWWASLPTLQGSTLSCTERTGGYQGRGCREPCRGRWSHPAQAPQAGGPWAILPAGLLARDLPPAAPQNALGIARGPLAPQRSAGFVPG